MDQANAAPPVDEPVEVQLARHIAATAAQVHVLGLVCSITLSRLEAEGIVRPQDVTAIHDAIEAFRRELVPQMLSADQRRFEEFAARFER